MIIAGFPGVGKTKFTHRSRLWVVDSDSSKFSWTKSGERNPDFPANYIEHIKADLNKGYVVLASTHKEVRDALRQNRMVYSLVYPERSCKGEYLTRYTDRGSPLEFLELLDKQWDNFIDQMEYDPCPFKHVLGEGKYLSDIIPL